MLNAYQIEAINNNKLTFATNNTKIKTPIKNSHNTSMDVEFELLFF
jgi:hypothetical protein